MENKENYTNRLTSAGIAREVLKANPDKEVFIQSGYSFKGASKRKPRNQEDLDRFLDWFCVCDIEVTDTEVFINGFSVNDME